MLKQAMRVVLSLAVAFGVWCTASAALAQEVAVWPTPLAVEVDDQGRRSFSLVVANVGVEAAQEVVLSDGLAPGTTLVSSQPPARVEGQRLVWALGDIAPGQSATVRLTLEGGADTGASVSARVGGTLRAEQALAVFDAPEDPELGPFLAPTVDADAADPEVLAFVASLDGDLARIKDFVRDEIGYEVYAGSLRGARGTLWSEHGNALDQASLLIAMLRAAGVPARYARTTLEAEAARALVETVFDEPTRVAAPPRDLDAFFEERWNAQTLGPYLTPELLEEALGDPQAARSTLFPDPLQDEALLGLARDHAYVEVFEGDRWVAFDPTFEHGQLVAESTAAALTDAERHLVTVSVKVETLNPAFGQALGGGEAEKLSVVLPSVSLVGKPVTLQQGVHIASQGGLVFSSFVHTYTPQLRVGEQLVAVGEPFQELLTSFPLGTEIVTGLFVDVTLDGPGQDGESKRFRHVAVDLLGASARVGGLDDGEVALDVSPDSPTLGAMDAVVVHVAPSWVPSRALLGMEPGLRSLQSALSARRPQIEAIESEPNPDAQERAFLAQTESLVAQMHAQIGLAAGLAFFDDSDTLSRALAEHFQVAAWPSAPRLTFVSVRATLRGPAPIMDIASDDVQVVAPEHAGIMATRGYRGARGVLASSLEGDAIAPLADEPGALISLETVFDAARAEGHQIRLITSANVLDLVRLELPADAEALILKSLEGGRTVLVPESTVTLGGEEQIMWLEIDPRSGEQISRDATGRRAALMQYVSLDNVKTFGQGVWLGLFSGFTEGTLVAVGKYLEARMLWGTKPPAGGVPAVWECGLAFIPVIDDFNAEQALSAATTNAPLTEAIALAFSLAAANAAPGPGTPLFLAGERTGSCIIGKVLGEAINQLLSLLRAGDPPLALSSTGLMSSLRRPLNAHRAEITAQPLPNPADPPQQFPGNPDWTLRGALSASPLAATFQADTFEGDGLLMGPEGAMGEGTWLASDVTAVLTAQDTAELSGQGRLSRHAQTLGGVLDHGELSGDQGAIVFLGTLEGQTLPEIYTLMASRYTAQLQGPLSLPSDTEVDISQGALTLGRDAWDGVDGRILPEGTVTTATAQGRLLGAPQEIRLERAQTALLDVSAQLTQPDARVELSAQAPRGWSAVFRPDGLEVTPAPGTPAGRWPLYVWAQELDSERVLMGATVDIVVEDSAPALDVTLEYVPLLTVDAGQGVQAPLVLRGEVAWKGPEHAQIALNALVPEGFTPQLAAQSLPLKSGQTGEIMLGLHPQGPLPAPGTPLEVTLEAEGQGVQGQGSVTIEMPPVLGGVLGFDAEDLRITPGQDIPVTLTIEPLGNASGTLSLEIEQVGLLSLNGAPQEVTLTPGETLELPLTARLQDGALPGLPYGVRVLLHRDQAIVGARLLRAIAVDPLAAQIFELAQRLPGLVPADTLVQVQALVTNVDQAARQCRPDTMTVLERNLNGLAADLTDEIYADLALRARQERDAVAEEGCEGYDPQRITGLIEDLVQRAEAARDHNFRIALAPNGLLIEPGQEADLALDVERLGALDTDIELVLEGVEGQVASPVSPQPLIEGHPVTVSPEGPGQRNFRVVATAVQAPELRRTVTGFVVAEPAWVHVTSLANTAPFALPGAQLRVVAEIFNAVNVPQTLLATVEVIRAADQETIYTSEEPTELSLLASPGVQRVDLDKVLTFDQPPGLYQLRLTLRQPDAVAPIPGGEATGAVVIGLPFEAQATVDAPLLPPGDSGALVTVDVTRRPSEVLPGVANPTLIERYATRDDGPNGLAMDADGQIFFSNFGTRRSSDQQGFEGERTVGRVIDLGQSEVIAEVGDLPTGMAIGPDGGIYVATVSPPERIWRIDPDTFEPTVYAHFDEQRPQGGGTGENIIGLAFDDQGYLYATDLYESFLLGGVIIDGKRIYRVHPDEDNDGRADLIDNLVNGGLARPTVMTIDPRTQDLIVSDSVSRRVVRVNTVGQPEVVRLVTLEDAAASGLAFDAASNLYVAQSNGDVQVFQTDVVDGRTTLGQGQTLLQGLAGPLSLLVDANGDLITTSFESNGVVRVRMQPAGPQPEVDLEVEHRVDLQSAQAQDSVPLGVLDGDVLGWQAPLSAEQEALSFAVPHLLEDLQPGQRRVLSPGTVLRATIDGQSSQVELPPVVAIADHLVGLAPASRTLRTGHTGTFTVSLRNLRDVEDTLTLSVEGLDASVASVLPQTVTLDPGADDTVELRLTPGEATALGSYGFAVKVVSALGGEDQAVGSIVVDRQGVLLEVSPPNQQVFFGQEAQLQVSFTRPPEAGCRAGTISSNGWGLVTGGRELSGLVDTIFEPNPFSRIYRGRVTAPPGTYTVRVSLRDLIGCVSEDEATATVTVVDDARISLSIDNLPETIYNRQNYVAAARITNHSALERTVRLTWSGLAFIGVGFDSGPHTIGPGQTLSVPVTVRPQSQSIGTRTHRFVVQDTSEGRLRQQVEVRTEIRQSAVFIALLRGAQVTATPEGTAAIGVRIFRFESNQPARPVRMQVSGPLAFAAEPSERQFNMNQRFNDFTVNLSGLGGLAPGPWPVRFSATALDDPDNEVFVTAFVTIPAGTVQAAFEPANVQLEEPGEALVALSLANGDFGAPQAATIAFESDQPGLNLPEEVSVLLGAGERLEMPLAIGAGVPGRYTVTATVTDGEGEVVGAAVLEVVVLDPANAPVISGLTFEPETPLEGVPFELAVVAEDPNEDPLVFDFDLDNDGVFEVTGAEAPTQPMLFEDDGVLRVRVAAQDPEGGRAEAEFDVPVLNVAPVFLGEPSTQALQDEVYLYEVQTLDVSADTVTLNLLEAPETARLTNNQLSWTPTRADARRGTAEFALTASDEDGGVREQRWTVEIPLNNSPPTPPELLSPEDEARVGVAVELEIEPSTDADGDPIVYTFEVLQGEEVAWTTQTPEVEATTEPLAPGEYTWRVGASDGLEDSAFSPARTFVVDLAVDNLPPGAPAFIEPEDGAEVSQFPVRLSWGLALDPESQPLTYSVEVADNEDFEDPIFEAEGLTPEEGQEVVEQVVEALVGGASWFARVRAHDPFVAGPAATVAFSTLNRPPAAPVLLAPLDGIEVEPGAVALRFEQAADPDGHAVTYIVEVFEDAERQTLAERFEAVTAPEEGPVEVSFAAPEDSATWFWTARAVDELGLESDDPGLEAFNVLREPDNQPPGSAAIVAPQDGDVLSPGAFELVFERAVDPDGDSVAYNVELEAVPEGDLVLERRRLELDEEAQDGRVEVQDLQTGAYRWRVQAVDVQGLEGPWSEAAFEVLLPENQPPSAPVPISPVDEALPAATVVTLEAQAGVDPEDGGGLEHVFVLFGPDGAQLAQATQRAEGDQVSAQVEIPEGVTGALEWTVQAIDSQGLEGAVATASFELEVAQDGATTDVGGVDGGCDCSTPGRSAPRVPWGSLLLVVVVGVGLGRRIRRRRSAR